MTQFSKLQARLDVIKSHIEDLELEEKNAIEKEKNKIHQKIEELRKEQLRLTQEVEDATGLSTILGTIHRG